MLQKVKYLMEDFLFFKKYFFSGLILMFTFFLDLRIKHIVTLKNNYPNYRKMWNTCLYFEVFLKKLIIQFLKNLSHNSKVLESKKKIPNTSLRDYGLSRKIVNYDLQSGSSILYFFSLNN